MTDLCSTSGYVPRGALRLPFGVGYVVFQRAAAPRPAPRRAAAQVVRPMARQAAGPTLADRLASSCGALVRLPARWVERRATIAALSSMDARQLSDIGLSRADVLEAAEEGVFANPGEMLAERAAERAAFALPRRCVSE